MKLTVEVTHNVRQGGHYLFDSILPEYTHVYMSSIFVQYRNPCRTFNISPCVGHNVLTQMSNDNLKFWMAVKHAIDDHPDQMYGDIDCTTWRRAHQRFAIFAPTLSVGSRCWWWMEVEWHIKLLERLREGFDFRRIVEDIIISVRTGELNNVDQLSRTQSHSEKLGCCLSSVVHGEGANSFSDQSYRDRRRTKNLRRWGQPILIATYVLLRVIVDLGCKSCLVCRSLPPGGPGEGI
jgi:hypothetical protein